MVWVPGTAPRPLENGFLAAVAPVKPGRNPLVKLQCPIQHPSLVKLRVGHICFEQKKSWTKLKGGELWLPRH